MWKLCALLSGSAWKHAVGAKLGVVGSRKAEWDMSSYEFCTQCGTDEVCNISSDASVSCQIEECGTPADLQDTFILGNIYNVGAKICYECQYGYVNKGGNTNCSVCSATGDWTPVDIECLHPTTTLVPTTTTTVTTTTSEPPIECGDMAWIEYEGHCYLRITTAMKWTQANSYCRSLGGYTLEIESASENTFIMNTFPSDDYWIGGSDRVWEGTFVWVSGKALTFTDWRPGEPNGGTGENCIRIDTDGKWRDKSCTWTLHTICEK